MDQIHPPELVSWRDLEFFIVRQCQIWVYKKILQGGKKSEKKNFEFFFQNRLKMISIAFLNVNRLLSTLKTLRFLNWPKIKVVVG